ncbi:hypothetical protein PMAYCL1PPCAC_02107, partial [Pristionchus mayeri]
GSVLLLVVPQFGLWPRRHRNRSLDVHRPLSNLQSAFLLIFHYCGVFSISLGAESDVDGLFHVLRVGENHISHILSVCLEMVDE